MLAILLFIFSTQVLSASDVLTIDTKKLCVPGYSATVRDVPVTLKKKVYKKYNVVYGSNPSKCFAGPNKSAWEVDHKISLSLGGSNDISNLQLQSYCGARNALDKDKDELRLLKEVCTGKTNIIKAQEFLRTWK
jgi:hypothetical protein